MREFKHRNLILNSKVTYTADTTAELRSAGFSSGHYIFSLESPMQIEEIVTAYREGAPSPRGKDIRRIGMREAEKKSAR